MKNTGVLLALLRMTGGEVRWKRGGWLECSGFGAEVGEQGFGGRLGVEDVGCGEPGAAELGDAVAHLVQLFGGVGVGVYYDLAIVLFGEPQI